MTSFDVQSGELFHRQECSIENRKRRSAIMLSAPLMCSFFFALALSSSVAQAPDWTRYAVKLPPPPIDGSSAASTFPQRAQIWLQYLACGQENEFLNLAIQDASSFTDDNILGRVMAKLQWLKLGNSACVGTFNVVYVQGTTSDFYDNYKFPDKPSFQQTMKQTFGSVCSSTFAVIPPSPSNPFTTVTSYVTADCLKTQIEFVLSRVQEGNAYPGTDGLPCNVTGKVTGNWDFTMKTLIRILLLDTFNTNSAPVLSPAVRDHIQNDLITVDGSPAPDSYSWTACGDNEKATGSPQDDEDENDPGNDLVNGVGDIFTWLLRRLLWIAIFLGATAVVTYVVGLTGLAATVLVAVGMAAILTGQIPESENHRLMIESTRFLKNQIIINDLGSDNARYIVGAQSDVKQWLLNKFQYIAENDFIEFNARPYHGLSLAALRNLADFSTDPDVRNGAQMLLEYSAAKFAVGSNQGRRLVPFRRHFSAVDCLDGQSSCTDTLYGYAPHPPIEPAEIFNDFVQIGDSAVSIGLLFNGQNQQVPFGAVSAGATVGILSPYGANGDLTPGLRGGLIPGAIGDAVAAATSSFIPDSMITDIAIRKDIPYYQRIHHAGYEIYSSSPSALITAGGIMTDHAYYFTIGGIGVPFRNSSDNLGAALPTTVMFTGDPQGLTGRGEQAKERLSALIPFRGNLKMERNDETLDESFTDNLCVWRNFACGINLNVPADIAQCLVRGFPQGGPQSWFFFDSTTCPAYAHGPHFFFVLCMICGQGTCLLTPTSFNPVNAGFIEVVDAPSGSLDDFQRSVIDNNTVGDLGDLGQGCLSGGDCKGHYHTVSGHILTLALRGHQDHSSETGITEVDGVKEKRLDDWKFAEGDIITSQGDGVIMIVNPNLQTTLILDFSDLAHPCRRSSPGQPCTQQ